MQGVRSVRTTASCLMAHVVFLTHYSAITFVQQLPRSDMFDRLLSELVRL